MSGTSMACPHVSGVAAVMLSERPNMTPEEVDDTLLCYSVANKLGSVEGDYWSDSEDRNLLQSPPSGFQVSSGGVRSYHQSAQSIPNPKPKPVTCPRPALFQALQTMTSINA